MIVQGLGFSPGEVGTIWPYLAVIALLAALAWYAWRRRSVPGVRYFALACLLAALWEAGAAAEASAPDALAKVAWFKFQAAWQLPAATAMACFVLEYVYPGRWLRRRTLALLALPPLAALALVLTNDLHHWMWRSFSAAGSIVPSYGTGYWILFGYGWLLFLANVIAFAWLFARSPLRRWPVAVMLAGHVASRALHLLDVVSPRSAAQPDPAILVVLLPFALYAIALFGFHILDPVPAAGATAIEQMREGMAVFDTDWRLLSLNPAAEHLLMAPAAHARGRSWQELLPSCPDPGRCLDPRAGHAEIGVGSGAEARRCALALSPLRDHRGLTIGHLLLLQDVTEQHRAQSLLLEQQWAQAALQERELLAQELHDGLAQDLAFLNLQAQAAHLYLRSGQVEAAQESVTRLAQVALEMQGDTRELMADLLTVSLPSEGLGGAVRRAVARLGEQTGIPVTLEMAGEPEGGWPGALPPAAGVQVLRILQESLANVRRHAADASRVSVSLRVEAGGLRMAVEDDGPGFDPARIEPGGKHFGLQVMARRAERIGGQLSVHSTPGAGTRVEVSVEMPEGADYA